jgi:hypothetical protein
MRRDQGRIRTPTAKVRRLHTKELTHEAVFGSRGRRKHFSFSLFALTLSAEYAWPMDLVDLDWGARETGEGSLYSGYAPTTEHAESYGRAQHSRLILVEGIEMTPRSHRQWVREGDAQRKRDRAHWSALEACIHAVQAEERGPRFREESGASARHRLTVWAPRVSESGRGGVGLVEDEVGSGPNWLPPAQVATPPISFFFILFSFIFLNLNLNLKFVVSLYSNFWVFWLNYFRINLSIYKFIFGIV